MKNQTTQVNIGFPVFSILGIVFITLKLCGVISWSWWWVLAPFWIPFVIFLLVLILIVLSAGIMILLEK